MQNLVGEIRKFRVGNVEWSFEVLDQVGEVAQVEVTTSGKDGVKSDIRYYTKGELETYGFEIREE